MTFVAEPPWGALRLAPSTSQAGHVWQEDDDARLKAWLEVRERIFVGTETVGKAIRVVGKRTSFHPVREWLEKISWDGKARFSSWLHRYLGASDVDYTRAVGQKWLLSAVARAFEPGCQADHMLILEGDQGIGKSSALRILGGTWHSETPSAIGTTDAYLALRGKWIVEMSELASMRRADIDALKTFLTAPSDYYRAPYAREAVEHVRHCVFAGTVNSWEGYLRDSTGNRRFWPVAVKGVDVEALTADREQLLAEAVVAYKAGERWWLDPTIYGEILDVATDEQDARHEGDAWEDPVGDFLCQPMRRTDGVTVYEVLHIALGTDVSDIRRGDEMRIAEILRRLGWEKRRIRGAGRVARKWRWFPAEVAQAPAQPDAVVLPMRPPEGRVPDDEEQGGREDDAPF